MQAFQGAHGAFLVTVFAASDPRRTEKELEEGRRLADAAKEVWLVRLGLILFIC